MLGTIRAHLRSNVVAYIALFVALGGTAYAGATITGSDVVDGSLTAADYKNNDIRSTDVRNDTSPNGGLTGADITESSLDLNGFFAANYARGGSGCFDDDENGEKCAEVFITVDQPSRLLINASGEWWTSNLNDDFGPGSGLDNTGAVFGRCELFVDGHTLTVRVTNDMGERSEGGSLANHPNTAPGTVALNGLTDALAAGPHSASVFCYEEDGDIDWGHFNLTVARVDN